MITPKQRAITALELKQPDIIPTFELEFQLTQEYFGKDFHTVKEWQNAISSKERERFIEDNAKLYIQIAEYFDYSIIMDSYAYYPSIAERLQSVRKIKELTGDKYMIIVHGDATYSIPDGNDMLEFTYNLVDKKDETKSQAEKMVRDRTEQSKKFVDAGVDGFALCSDYCLNTGPFLSPKMFAEFVTPYLAKLISEYGKMGMYTIKHTDGNILPIIEQLVACEPHALHSLDPQAKVDIKKVKKTYGNKVCLIGNVMCSLMQTGTEQEILESARYAMENGRPGGGYIFSTSNVVFKGMPSKSYDLIMDYYKKNRNY
jgi:uroporphyrinogen decarboxylase